MVRVHAANRVGHGERIGRRFVGHARLGLATGSVLVVRVFLHVQSSQTFGLVDERPLFVFVQQFPFGTFREFKCSLLACPKKFEFEIVSRRFEFSRTYRVV